MTLKKQHKKKVDDYILAVINDDDILRDKDEAGIFLVGGKRAREALKQVEELEQATKVEKEGNDV